MKRLVSGSIRADESAEEAALRELREEIGYNCFELVKFLGTAKYNMAPYRSELQERYFYLVQLTTLSLPERFDSQEDHDGQGAPTRFECF